MKKTKKSKACQSKMQMVHNPFSELTSEEGDKHSLELRLARTEKYHSHLSKIIEVIHSVDVLHLFSILTLHTLFSTINNKNEISQLKCNVDQTHIELLQAIALKFTESELGIQFPDSDTVSTMIDILPEFSQSYSEMNSEIIQSDEQITPELIVQELIKLNTQHIRNWGYFYRVRSITKRLLEPLNGMFTKLIGMSTDDLIDTFEYLIKRIEKKITNRYNSIAIAFKEKSREGKIRKYFLLNTESIRNVESMINYANIHNLNTKELRFVMLSHMETLIKNDFIFTIDEIVSETEKNKDSILSIFNKFSIDF